MARRRSSLGAWISNWERSDLPLGERLRVALRNSALRVARLEPCCRHPGQPGC